jgi:hypothetical protein
VSPSGFTGGGLGPSGDVFLYALHPNPIRLLKPKEGGSRGHRCHKQWLEPPGHWPRRLRQPGGFTAACRVGQRPPLPALGAPFCCGPTDSQKATIKALAELLGGRMLGAFKPAECSHLLVPTLAGANDSTRKKVWRRWAVAAPVTASRLVWCMGERGRLSVPASGRAPPACSLEAVLLDSQLEPLFWVLKCRASSPYPVATCRSCWL